VPETRGAQREYLYVQRHLSELKTKLGATISRKTGSQAFALGRMLTGNESAGSRIKLVHR
jgi:hypothetical protein